MCLRNQAAVKPAPPHPPNPAHTAHPACPAPRHPAPHPGTPGMPATTVKCSLIHNRQKRGAADLLCLRLPSVGSSFKRFSWGHGQNDLKRGLVPSVLFIDSPFLVRISQPTLIQTQLRKSFVWVVMPWNMVVQCPPLTTQG